jgi:hypothetical protein
MAEKGQKDKQRSTKHTHKTKNRVTQTQLKTGVVVLMFYSLNSCTSGALRLSLDF